MDRGCCRLVWEGMCIHMHTLAISMHLIGPSHMEKFVKEAIVVEKFKEASQYRDPQIVPSVGQFCSYMITIAFLSLFGIMHFLENPQKKTTNPILLFSDNPADYTADVLYLLLPAILNPKGIALIFSHNYVT